MEMHKHMRTVWGKMDSHILVKHSNPSEILWFQEDFPPYPWKDKTENAAQLLVGRQGRM